MKLNVKGQCPTCLVKPIVYKKNPHKFCCRCDRSFNLETGEQMENWAWQAAGTDVERRPKILKADTPRHPALLTELEIAQLCGGRTGMRQR